MMRSLLFLVFITGFVTMQSQDPEVLEKLNKIDTNNPLVKSELRKLGVTESDINSLKSDDNPKVNIPIETEKETKEPGGQSSETSKPIIAESPIGISEYFGYQVFKSNSIDFSKSNKVRASDNYIIGEGDEFLINIWGYSELNESYKVEYDGAINVHLLGKIFLKELSYKEAKDVIKSKLGTIYDLKNSNISIELVYSRDITVHVVGEVNNPGSFTVNATNSAFNILKIAGGIKESGTLRNINLIRDGELVHVIDLYKFLLNPLEYENIFLQEGDYIVVNTRKNSIEIDGAVNRPMKFEFLDNEQIKDLIYFSGGFRPRAIQNRLQIERVDSFQIKMYEVSETSNGKNFMEFPLKNGDKVIVHSVNTEIENYIRVEGAVKVPGKYAFEIGEKLSDLIDRSGGLSDKFLKERGYVIRTNRDLSKSYIPFNVELAIIKKDPSFNLTLQHGDVIVIYSEEEYSDELYVTIHGAVREPGKIRYAKGLTLQDVVFLSGGMKIEASNTRIEVSRLKNISEDGNNNSLSTEVELLTFKLEGNDFLTNDGEKFMLNAFDNIFVRTVPDFEYQQNIFLKGEVKYPGVYTLQNKKETLKDVIERAGGYTDWAFLEGATFTRKIDSVGVVVLDLNALYNKNALEYNYILKDGDEIFIPKITNLVSIGGEINYPNIDELKKINAPYIKGRRSRYYIKNFGMGYSKDGDKSKVYVITKGGKVKQTKKVLFFKISPKVKLGDEIIVKKKVKNQEKNKDGTPIDWNVAIENITIKLTGILTVWVLVKNVTS